MLKRRMWLAVGLAAQGLGVQAALPDAHAIAAQAHSKAALLTSQRVPPHSVQRGVIAPASEYDLTNPVLTQFGAGKQLTVGPGFNQLLIGVSATDDLVGLMSVYVSLIGPSGQWVMLSPPTLPTSPVYSLPAPTQWSGAIAWQPTETVQAGVWRVDSLTLEDYNGNRITYEEAQLAQMGNTRIVVTSPGSDSQGPALLAGQVMTPRLSVSRTIPGSNGQAQYVRINLNAQDVGLAGLRQASVRLCIAGDRDCHYDMYLRGDASGERGSKAVMVEVARQLPWEQLAGTYEIREVSLLDQAGNQTFLTSRTYGGNTDFTTLFPTTTLKVKP